MRCLLALLLSCWSLSAGAQEDVYGALSVESGTVVLAPEETRVVEVGPFTEVIVLDDHLLAVERAGPRTLRVSTGSTPGTAVLLLLDVDSTRSITVRIAMHGEVVATRQPTNPFAPELHTQGSVSIRDSAGTSITTFSESFLWRQRTARGVLDAGFGIQRTPYHGWRIPSLGVGMRTPRWDARLGDVDLDPTGALGGAMLRGFQASHRIADSPGSVGLVVGAARNAIERRYFDPQRYWMAAASGQWVRPSGFYGSALTGYIGQPDDQTGAVFARLSGGYRRNDSHYALRYAQSGRGASLYGHASSTSERGVSAIARGAVLTPGYFTPGIGPSEGAYAHASLRLGAPITDRVSLGGTTSWQQALGSGEPGHVGAALGTFFHPSERLHFGAGYGLTLTTSEQLPLRHALQGFATGQLHREVVGRLWTSLTTGHGSTTANTGTQLAWTPDPRLRLASAYQLGWTGERTHHRGSFDVNFSPDTWDVGFSTHVNHIEGRTTPALAMAGGWRPSRAVHLGTRGQLNFPAPSEVGWLLQAFWTLSGSVFGRAGQGLGFRGSVVGRVYLDANRNGVFDDGELPLPEVEVAGGGQVIRTDAEGWYRFRNLRPGAMGLEARRGDLFSWEGTSREVAVRALQRQRVDFAMAHGGRIEGRIYVDLDEDGRFGMDDTAIPCGAVSIVHPDGSRHAAVAPSGWFSVPGLAPDTYTLEIDPFELPPEHGFVDDLVQSALVERGEITFVSFRLRPERAIGGQVWLDADDDGRPGTEGDRLLSGVDIFLSDGRRMRTDSLGRYLFRDLSHGTFEVSTEFEGGPIVEMNLGIGPQARLETSLLVPSALSEQVARTSSVRASLSRALASAVVTLVPEATEYYLQQGEVLVLDVTATFVGHEPLPVGELVEWSVEDETVVGVVGGNRLVALEPGTTTVRGSLEGASTPDIRLDVSSSALVGLNVHPESISTTAGAELSLSAEAILVDGTRSEATNEVRWRVRDPSIARVEPDGTLRALSPGTTEVYAEWQGVRSYSIAVEVGE